MVYSKQFPPPPPTTKRRHINETLPASLASSSNSSEAIAVAAATENSVLSYTPVNTTTTTTCQSSISPKMSTRQSYVFLGLAVLLTIIATVHAGPVSTTTQAEVSEQIMIKFLWELSKVK